MFIQFLHDQLLVLERGDRHRALLDRVPAVKRALRWAAFLSRDPLYIPTVDLVQSPLADQVVPELSVLGGRDCAHFVGSSVVLDDLFRSKQAHFRQTRLLGMWEDRDAGRRLTEFETLLEARRVNTTADLKYRWMAEIGRFITRAPAPDDSPFLVQLREAAILLDKAPGNRRFAGALTNLPRRLEDHAFLWDVVQELRIFPFRTTGEPARRLEVGLAWEWITSHLDEYRTTLLVRIPGLGEMDFGVASTHREAVVDLNAHIRAMRLLKLETAFDALSLDEIVSLGNQPKVQCLRDALLASLARQYQGRKPVTQPKPGVLRAAQQVRDAVALCNSPSQAIAAAADVAMGVFEPPFPHVAIRNSITVGVVVALIEELLTMRDAVEEVIGRLEPIDSAISGMTTYRAGRRTGQGLELKFVFALIGKGQERAAAATAQFIAEHKPDVVVNVGIAGALSPDVGLGDVVVADTVFSYLSDSKATEAAPRGFKIIPGGQPVPTDRYLTERAAQIDLRDRQRMAEIRQELAAYAAARLDGVEVVDSLKFRVIAGPLASGPIVAAAGAFKQDLLRLNRNLVAVDMESSGAGIAADLGGMVSRVRYFVLRGISDLADAAKGDLEAATKGAVRQIATVAPLYVMLAVLESAQPDVLENPRQV
jgi:nucleoside phosphorylase